MLAFLVYGAIAAFAGIALLGHILVLQAMLTRREAEDESPALPAGLLVRSRA